MTVAELRELLARFDGGLEVEFLSHDGPGFGYLEVGTRSGGPGAFLDEGAVVISERGLE